MAQYTKTTWNQGDLITKERMDQIEDQLSLLTPPATNIVEDFISDKTYRIGDYCTYNGKLYYCKKNSAGVPSPSNEDWRITTVMTELTIGKGNKTLIAAIETSNTATIDYLKGDYFILNNSLYCALTDIPKGTTFVINTNCFEKRLGEEVSGIKKAHEFLLADKIIEGTDLSWESGTIQANGDPADSGFVRKSSQIPVSPGKTVHYAGPLTFNNAGARVYVCQYGDNFFHRDTLYTSDVGVQSDITLDSKCNAISFVFGHPGDTNVQTSADNVRHFRCFLFTKTLSQVLEITDNLNTRINEVSSEVTSLDNTLSSEITNLETSLSSEITTLQNTLTQESSELEEKASKIESLENVVNFSNSGMFINGTDLEWQSGTITNTGDDGTGAGNENLIRTINYINTTPGAICYYVGPTSFDNISVNVHICQYSDTKFLTRTSLLLGSENNHAIILENNCTRLRFVFGHPNGTKKVDDSDKKYFQLYLCTNTISHISEEIKDIQGKFNEFIHNTVLFEAKKYGTYYFRYDILQGHMYEFHVTGTSVGIGTAEVDEGDRVDLISTGIYPAPSANPTSVVYTATADRPYLRMYFNGPGTVTMSELSVPLTQLLLTSPYIKLRFKYRAKALGGDIDDDVAIQNYINDEPYVYIPAGKYKLKNPLVVTRPGQVIEGEGYGFLTELRPYDDSVTSLIFAHRVNPNSLMLTVRGICFRMVNVSNGKSNPGAAISSGNDVIIDSKIEHCWFNGGGQQTEAPLRGKALSFHGVHTMILGCWFEQFETAAEIRNTNGNNGIANGYTFQNCTFWNVKNCMKLGGLGTVLNCNFATIKGGYIVKTDEESFIEFANNRIKISSPIDQTAQDTVNYGAPGDTLFIVNHDKASLIVRDISISDNYDTTTVDNSNYKYIFDIQAGQVYSDSINLVDMYHIKLKNHITSKSIINFNQLENICQEVIETGSTITLSDLCANCMMEITATDDTTVVVQHNNETIYTFEILANESIILRQYEGTHIITSSDNTTAVNVTVKAYQKVGAAATLNEIEEYLNLS